MALTSLSADERRYMLRHPGPSGLHQWVREKKLKWIGVDCGSADHPMNTKIDGEPMEAERCNQVMLGAMASLWNELYPWPEHYQAMHFELFTPAL